MDWWEMPPVQGQGWRGGRLSWALQELQGSSWDWREAVRTDGKCWEC